MPYSENALAILAKRSYVVDESPSIFNPNTIRETGTRQQSVRHSLFSWRILDTFNPREFPLLGNQIAILNKHLPYNLSVQSERSAWLTFDDTQVADALQVSGTQQFVDSRVLFLTGGLKTTRAFERFRLYIPSSPVVLGGVWFQESNFLAGQSTMIQLLAASDMDTAIERLFSSQDGFSVSFGGIIGAADSDSFEFLVPYNISKAFLEVSVTGNDNAATYILRRQGLDGNDIVETTLNFPASATIVQQEYETNYHHTSGYSVEMTAGGAVDDGEYRVTLTWIPRE